MKIAFEARWVLSEPSGIGIYSRELLRRLPLLAPDVTFVILFKETALRDRTLAETAIDTLPNVQAVCLREGLFDPRSQLHLPAWLRREQIQLYHSPNYLLPYGAFPLDQQGGIAAVTTIHDVIPFVVPNHAPRSRKMRLWPLFVFCMRQSVARSDAVITVSDASREDLIRALKLSPRRAGRIRRVYNGVDPAFSPDPCPPTRDGQRPRTVLYVGRLDPYKNVELLVRVFGRLQAQCQTPLRLRIIGPPDPRYPQARQAARDLGIEASVAFEGFLDADGLLQAYREADVLAHPSRYEGFGLQLLEAMRCGLPVVCASAGAMPEIAEDAALQVPVDDAEALCRALHDVLHDPMLARRLSLAGRSRAERFTWDQTAAETLAIYRDLLEKRA